MVLMQKLLDDILWATLCGGSVEKVKMVFSVFKIYEYMIFP